MKKTLALMLALLMVLGVLAGCKPAAETQSGTTQGAEATAAPDLEKKAEDLKQSTEVDAAKTYKKTFTYAYSGPVTETDPQMKMNNVHDTLFKLIFNQLVVYNFDTKELEPELATEWKMEDAKTFWFKLREGVTFSNGESFTADDVVYTLVDRPKVTGATAAKAVWGEIEKIDVIGDYEIRIFLTKPDADFLFRLYLQSYSMFDRKTCEADPEKGHMIGTGGWIWTEFVPSETQTLQRNDSSWVWGDNMTPTETFVFRRISETSAATIALQTGDLDATVPGAADVEIIEADKNLESFTYASEALTYMLFSMQEGAIAAQDKNLRYAISYGTNINDMNEYKYQGTATRAYSMWGKNQYGLYEDFNEKLEFDQAKAKEYLAKSNYKGETVELYTVAGFAGLATLFQEQMKQIGVTVNINETDSAGLTTAVKDGAIDVLIYNVSLQTIGDRFHFIPDISNATNRARWDNPELELRFDDALAATTDADRLAIYKEIQTTINEEKVYVPFFYEVATVAWRKGVSGITWSPDTKPDLTFAKAEQN